ncbi:MAG: uroporphyrinogen decarboxylase family protein [bacterium]
MGVQLEKVKELFRPDRRTLERGRERMAKVTRGEEADVIPIFKTESVDRDEFPRYTLKEQFYDKEKMAYEHLWNLISVCRGGSDMQLMVRANFGVGTIPSIFGLKERFVQDDDMPWVDRHLSKKEIAKFEFPQDVSRVGFMPKVEEYCQYFKEVLGPDVHIQLSDTQGPFDIAHLLRGPELYIDIYDDPPFVHSLMELSTQAYIEVTKFFKRVSGEPMDRCYHSGMYIDSAGVRLCDDSATTVSPEVFEEFILPYNERALAPFGGGFVHFCGNGNHILKYYLESPLVKVINFGNPEMHDYSSAMESFERYGKVYFGGWPREEGETLEDYYLRILGPKSRRGGNLIFTPAGTGDWPDAKTCVSVWRRVASSTLERARRH